MLWHHVVSPVPLNLSDIQYELLMGDWPVPGGSQGSQEASQQSQKRQNQMRLQTVFISILT